jgi:hypothetical protein
VVAEYLSGLRRQVVVSLRPKSVSQPAKANLATCNAILQSPVCNVASRTGDYLVTLVMVHLREHRIAALHLDEVQR